MIQGGVNSRNEAVVQLRVRGPVGAESIVDVIVDSGYTASLTLPSNLVSSLGLVRQSGGTVVLGDGTVRPFDIFGAEVDWDGTWRPVLVSAVGNEALLGMRLLAGHRLAIEVVPGGLVEIVPLP